MKNELWVLTLCFVKDSNFEYFHKSTRAKLTCAFGTCAMSAIIFDIAFSVSNSFFFNKLISRSCSVSRSLNASSLSSMAVVDAWWSTLPLNSIELMPFAAGTLPLGQPIRMIRKKEKQKKIEKTKRTCRANNVIRIKGATSICM